MLNCGLGTPIAAVLLLVKGGELAAGLRLLLGAAATRCPFRGRRAVYAGRNERLTAPSVSLEGRHS